MSENVSSKVAAGRPRGRAAGLAALLVLFVLPLALRLGPVDHGLPRGYVPDTHMVRSALGMAQDKDLVPPVGKYSSYPYLVPYALLPIYAAQYAAGRATGAWSGSGEFKNHVLEHPETVALPARALVALLGALTAWVVFRAARAAGLGRGAWVAAWLVATGLLHVQFSTQERPWVPMVFCLALGTWAAARYGRTGARRDLVLTGVTTGLAFACHQAGLPMLGLAALAWLTGPLGWRGPELKQRLVDGLFCVAAFAVVALLLGHAYYLVYGAPAAGEIAAGEALEQLDGVTFSAGGQGFVFAVRWASLAHLGTALVGYDPVLVVLALVGLCGALVLRGTRATTLFGLAWAALFMTNQNDHVRYLLPLTVLLAPSAGVAGELLLRYRAGRVVLPLLLALPLVQAVRFGWLLERLDTRALGEVVLEQLPEGSRVAVDRYGPLVELNAPALERLASWRTLGSREEFRKLMFEVGVEPAGGAGLDALFVEDLFLFEDRTGTYALKPAARGYGRDADEVLRNLGVTHLLLVDRRPGDGVPPLLVGDAGLRPGAAVPRGAPRGAVAGPPLEGLGEPLVVVDPSEGRGCREALLPTDMDFPLTGLWQVRRPGPRLELYALR